ncbi:YbhB/YbcL family Raf kinase inhibitor-like protein [Candidatus Dependentiae bacterium]|nr:YbhB/YbcL family Raf kinase inhibitor-like protein [Candidatus Dependentiae bacterium]
MGSGFTLSSKDFANGGSLNTRFTCVGKNETPSLRWTGAPAGTKTFALIMDDPDVPTKKAFVHWIVFNIPATKTGLSHSLKRSKMISDGTKQGSNSLYHIGFDGPCPPSGKEHRYYFRLYALDKILDLQPTITKEQLVKAMEGSILAEAELMGTYKRV